MSTEKKTRRRVRLHEVDENTDLRYRGPLTYQHLQILGWLCIAASQAAVLLRLLAKADLIETEGISETAALLTNIGRISLPLLLIANFAQILDYSDGYRKQLTRNLTAAFLVAVPSILLFYRYLVGSLAGLITRPDQAAATIEAMVRALTPAGFISFNLFIDLSLCTLVMLFLNYKPKRFFTGKRLVAFRLFTLLPVAYEVVCMMLKVQSANGDIQLPLWSYPLLTVKPPMTFVLFIILAAFIKIRELRFRRHGKTHEEYRTFLKTRRNSRNFSAFLAGMMILVSAADALVMLGYSTVRTAWRISGEISGETGYELPADPEEGMIPAMPVDSPTGEALLTEDEWLDILALAGEEDPEMPGTEHLSAEEGQQNNERTEKYIREVTNSEFKTVEAIGFGGSINLIFLAPMMLLFSYTREPRVKEIDRFIAPAGIIVILIVVLEILRGAMWHLPFEKVDMLQMIELLRQSMRITGQ